MENNKNSSLKKYKNIKCGICLNNKFAIVKTSCKHRLCLDCLNKLIKLECPYCRKSIKNEIPGKFNNLTNNQINNPTNNTQLSNNYFNLQNMMYSLNNNDSLIPLLNNLLNDTSDYSNVYISASFNI